MAVYKEEKTGTWRAVYRYTDWNGERKQTQKRGFKTKREAQAWEREQIHKTSADLDMNFKSFVELYTADMKTRLKENTWATKEHIIRTKLLPYFGKLKMCNITAQQIITWQNEMMNHKDEKGQPYSPVYLKTVHNQLSAIFNHAVRYYNLRDNPCKKAGSMGKKKNREMMFWTKEQYLKFAEVMMDKPLSFYAFEMLYWCGIREGELLALTPSDFDFEKRTVTINKSYAQKQGKKAPQITPQESQDDEEARDIENEALGVITNLIIQKTKGHGLAKIVDAILRAKGFTTYVSPAGPDKGVDILASAGTLGFGSPKICVQVKSTDTPVDRIVLDQLGGVMKNFGAEYGLLVSWSGFKSSVINETAKQFFEIRLWTHKEIIEEFLRYYDQMDDEIKELIPLKKIWVVNNSEE